MATVPTLIDDMNGEPADETIRFGFDGEEYEIDLTPANAKQFRDVVQPYRDAGRKAKRKAGRKAGPKVSVEAKTFSDARPTQPAELERRGAHWTQPRKAAPKKARQPYRHAPDPRELLAVLKTRTLVGTAEHYDVPTHTVHRWVKTMRKNGHKVEFVGSRL